MEEAAVEEATVEEAAVEEAAVEEAAVEEAAEKDGIPTWCLQGAGSPLVSASVVSTFEVFCISISPHAVRDMYGRVGSLHALIVGKRMKDAKVPCDACMCRMQMWNFGASSCFRVFDMLGKSTGEKGCFLHVIELSDRSSRVGANTRAKCQPTHGAEG